MSGLFKSVFPKAKEAIDEFAYTKFAEDPKLKDEKPEEIIIEGIIASFLTKETIIHTNALIGYVALLGDMGAAIQDFYNRPPKIATDEEKVAHASIGIIASEFSKIFATTLTTFKRKETTLKEVSKLIYDARSPDKFYLVDGVMAKGKERASCTGADKKTNMTPRTGILNLGEDIDKPMKLKMEKRIPKIGWPWQTVPKKLVEGCPNEPWAGHYSGSLYEILLMLDLTTDTEPIKKIDISTKEGKVEIKDREVKAAIAAGFLIATGMHSAVEERFVIGEYLGQSITLKASCDDATRYITGVIKPFNQGRRLK